MRKSFTTAFSILLAASACSAIAFADDKGAKSAEGLRPAQINGAAAADASAIVMSAKEQIARGDQLLDQDKYDAAIAAFRAALVADPTSSLAHQRLAVVWLERGNADYAQAEDEAAIKLDPRNAVAYQHLGLSLGILQNFAAAAEAEKKAIELKPDFQDAYDVLGKALSSGGHYGEAVVALNKAIELDPKDLDSYLTLGAAYGRKSNYADAVKTYQKAVAVSPNSAEAHTGLGQAYGHLGDSKNQISELRTAVKLGMNDPSTHGHLGSALTKAGDIDGALKEGAAANQLRLGQSWTSVLNKFLLGWACVFLLFGTIFGVIFAGSKFKLQAEEQLVKSFFLVFYKDRPGRFIITSRRFLFIPEAFSRWFGSTRVSIERDLIAKMQITKTPTGGTITIETADGSKLPFKMSSLIFEPLSKELQKIGYGETFENQSDTLQMDVSQVAALSEKKST